MSRSTRFTSLTLPLLALTSLSWLSCAGSSGSPGGNTGGSGRGGDTGGDDNGGSGGGSKGGSGGNSGSGGSKGGNGGSSTGSGGSSSTGGQGGSGQTGTGGTGQGGSSVDGTGGTVGGDTGGTAGDSGTGGTGGSPASGGGTIPSYPCDNQVDNVAPSVNPPGGLTVDKAPMFIMLGIDDNGFADGINWVLDNLRNRKNPDGTAVRATFFVSAGFDSEFFNGNAHQTQADLLAAWKKMKSDGHEIGNHSWSHADTLQGADTATWTAELNKANDLFVNTLGIEKCQLWGFRTPFLAFSQSTFDAIKSVGFRYDASVEFGYDWWQPPGSDMGWGPGTAESGKHYYWPFTMNQPWPPGFANKGVNPIPGVWEIPVYTFNKVTGDTASTVTGLDYNLWNRVQTDSTTNFTDVLKTSLDQRLAGNRSPFALGMHSDIYSQYNATDDMAWPAFNYLERRKALLDFIEYAQTKPEVRFVTFRGLIEWMRNPKGL